jgi:hypothetical protein
MLIHIELADIYFDSSNCDINTEVRKALGIKNLSKHDYQFIFISNEGHACERDLNPQETASIKVVISGLEGGKGGFGAQLKSLAKQKGAKRTVDFGACRDLSGRRLRQINHEVLLAKWKESKDRGDEFDTEQATATGIELWFLSAPSWADGLKVDKRKKFMKSRYKTTLCSDWVRARETESPPKHAPVFWGCPRGLKCEFAHGTSELRGWGKEEHEKSVHDSRYEAENEKKMEYFEPLESALRERDETEINSLVRQGLHAKKRARTIPSNKIVVPDEDKIISQDPVLQPKFLQEELQVLCGVMLGEGASGSNRGSHDDTNTPPSHSIPGVPDGGLVLTGCSSFSTSSLLSYHITSVGSYYYEVQLLSDGLMQIGWCDAEFTGGSELENLGVGDDEHSWAFDGLRNICLHNGKETNYLCGNSDCSWTMGETIGCLLDIQTSLDDSTLCEVKMLFTVQGLSTMQPIAFHFTCAIDTLSFYPAISLESGESICLNTQHAPFAFHQQSLALLMTVKQSKVNTSFPSSSSALNHNDDRTITNCNNHSSQSIEGHHAEEEIILTDEMLFNLQAKEDLYQYGGDVLKKALMSRGLKCGGTIEERASRLFAVRGLRSDQIDSKLRSKPHSKHSNTS